MKRFVASIGLLLLACQVALGSTGSLFLCLCAPHETQCTPPAPSETQNCCAPTEKEEPSATKEACTDLLITADDLQAIEFSKDSSKLSPSPVFAAFELPQLHRPADLFERQPRPARAPPDALSPQALNTQTIELLL